jgi:CRP-like cAMP-binding protein
MRRHTPFRIASSEPTRDPPSSALFLSETVEGLNDGANFLRNCPPADMALVRRNARSMVFKSGDPVFLQGHCHEGIYLIEVGIVRVYYTGPSGREITLAYWPPGHFIGGPEIFGGGTIFGPAKPSRRAAYCSYHRRSRHWERGYQASLLAWSKVLSPKAGASRRWCRCWARDR